MKQLSFFLIIIILTCLFSCGEPPVTFSEPQPTNIKNIPKFPDQLQGKYLSVEDNSTLLINDKLIQRIYDFDQKIHLSQLDSNYSVLGDTIINLTTNEREIIKRNGDSLITHTHIIDTLFQLNYDNVVRKFKGYYFLNKRYGKESWEVKKIELSKGQLYLSCISIKEDIENLRKISESTQDTSAPYKFETSKKQFKEFIRNDGFSESEIFIKQK